MGDRDGYQHGVPCWVETIRGDPGETAEFYKGLFGWEAEDRMPPDAASRYLVFTLDGQAVAAAGSPPPDQGPPPVPAWGTYVWVDSADDTAAKVTAAGGSILAGPIDVLDAGRMAIMADPSGAVLGIWQAAEARGAERVNETGAWSWSGLNTRDPESATRFYGEVFGWEPETMDLGGSDYTLFHVSGYVGGEPEQPVARDVVAGMAAMTDDRFAAEVPPHWSIDFWVDDVDASADRAAELG